MNQEEFRRQQEHARRMRRIRHLYYLHQLKELEEVKLVPNPQPILKREKKK